MTGHRRNSKRYPRRICFAISGLLIGIAAAFVVGELLVRAIPHLRVSTVTWASDDTMGAVLRPNQKARFSSREFNNTVIINSRGQHDYEHDLQKSEGIFRILLLGDSYVEGLHVSRDKLFFNLLCAKLNSQSAARAARYEFVPLARSGWGTGQELIAFETIGLKYHPDMVILLFLPENDFFNSDNRLMQDAFLPYYNLTDSGDLKFVPAVRDRSRDSMLYRTYKKSQFLCCVKQGFAMSRFGTRDSPGVSEQFGIYRTDPPKEWEQAVKITFACLKRLNEICTDNPTSFVCVSLTTKYLVEQMDISSYRRLYPDMAKHEYEFDYPYKLLEEFCGDHSIEYTCMVEYFRNDYSRTGKSSHFAEDGHWNEYGHQLAATFLFDYLKRHAPFASGEE